MSRRRHDGRRRAAKVERRLERRRTPRPPREGRSPAGTAPANAPLAPRAAEPERATAELGALLGGFLADLDDDLDDEGWDDGWDDEDDDEDDYFELLQDRVRTVVADTVDREDGEIARTFVAGCLAGSRVLVDVTVAAWLAKAGRRVGGDVSRRAVRWVAEHLGEAGPVVDDAARLLGSEAAAARNESFLRTPDDVLVARLWLLAALLTPAVGGAAARVDLLCGP
ncbi:hypothetical protein [Actinomycetospora flava]|uniref:DUF222 domain-containing protein n=1 Tax=Actinomycetospora flava TaxID=3129232 RepID=A0ABU8M404_9PSEU